MAVYQCHWKTAVGRGVVDVEKVVSSAISWCNVDSSTRELELGKRWCKETTVLRITI